MHRNLAIIQINKAFTVAVSVISKTLRNAFHNLSDKGSYACSDSNVITQFDVALLVL
jgi:hypothetical protein